MQNYVPEERIQPTVESVNKYVYVKQNFVPAMPNQAHTGSKVLVNPLFNKKVFVNPNYHAPPPVSIKIHINPRIKTADLAENVSSSKIHINPKVLRNIPAAENKFSTSSLQNDASVATPRKRVRRSSICSKFKIVRSTYPNLSIKKPSKMVNTRYKFSRGVSSSIIPKLQTKSTKVANKYKVDNRKTKNMSLSPKNKFVFVNRFLSMGELAKKVLLKTSKKSKPSFVNIRGTVYKKSPNSLRRASTSKKVKVQNLTISKSKYKFVRRTLLATDKNKSRYTKRVSKIKSNVSYEKLRKCNIPCPYYRKFGRCKGKDIGKCNRKHDPDQVALCTKFLQGACIDNKCLLSHNVSSEKMPTCKFYLEGTCSRDDCPYLHVRISPKADICRDFLEGFCKKASECDRRHQFSCPDYEKRGCAKVRCPYPHGKMVRKYSLLNRNKFAKKSSDDVPSTKRKEEHVLITDPNKRYYDEGKVGEEQNASEFDQDEGGFRSRPKLGDLPSYIAFKES